MKKVSRLLTSNRPSRTGASGTAAVTAMLDRLLHHAHVLTCGPRSHSEYATTLSAWAPALWPVLPRPRMAGFEVSTEARTCVEDQRHYRDIPSGDTEDRITRRLLDEARTRYNTHAWSAAFQLAGFAPSTTARFSGVHRGGGRLAALPSRELKTQNGKRRIEARIVVGNRPDRCCSYRLLAWTLEDRPGLVVVPEP